MSIYTVVTDGDGADPAWPTLTVHDACCPQVDGSGEYAVAACDLVAVVRQMFGYTGNGYDRWIKDFADVARIMPCTDLPVHADPIRITEHPAYYDAWTAIAACRRTRPLEPAIAAYVARMYANLLKDDDILAALAAGQTVGRTDAARAVDLVRPRCTHPDDRHALDALAAYIAAAARVPEPAHTGRCLTQPSA